MVSIIKNQLLKHLSRFTKNLSADKINLSTFKGEGELSNLELDENVLTELLELPSWLQLEKAWCNRVLFRIPWTKLKSVPIYLNLDEVNIIVKTCEELRTPTSPSMSPYSAVPGKYSFIHKVIDGITINVNTVYIIFNSPAFTASVQISRIIVESKSPHWQRGDLRVTRLKNSERGQVLVFKELEWQTARIEAKSTVDRQLTPLRLLTNHARCRLTIKKRLSDCFVLGSRLVLILDDLLWVLTDSQLKAALHFLQSLAGLVQRATLLTRQEKAVRKLEVLPEHQAQVAQEARANPTSSQAHSQSAVTNLFKKLDVIETSYHFLSQHIVLHLCDDPGNGRSCHPNLCEGGALQISVHGFQVDYYPYHLATGDRKHWARYRETAVPQSFWLAQSLAHFRSRLLDTLDGSRPPPHTPLARTTNNQDNGGRAKEIQSPPGAGGSTHKKPTNSANKEILKQLAKLMTTCIILRIEDFSLYKVTTSGKKQALKEFISGDRDHISLPEDTNIVHAEFTYFYYPGDVAFPLPPPKFYVQLNPVQIYFDMDSCLWFNSFMLHLHQSLSTPAADVASLMYIDVKIEAILPRIIFESSSEHLGQRDRPRSVHIQVTRATVTNVRSLEQSSRADLARCVDMLYSGCLFFGSEFPSRPGDPYAVTQKLLDHVSASDDLHPTDQRRMLWTDARDVWSISMEPLWADFYGARSVGAGNRPVPFIDAVPVTCWLHMNGSSDIHALLHVSNLVSAQINHYQYLFLLRLAEELSELTTYLALDQTRILGREQVEAGTLVVAALLPQLELTFVMPSACPGKESSGGDLESVLPDSSSIADDMLAAAGSGATLWTAQTDTSLNKISSDFSMPPSTRFAMGETAPNMKLQMASLNAGEPACKLANGVADLQSPTPTQSQPSSNMNANFNTGLNSVKKGLNNFFSSIDSALKSGAEDMSDTMSWRSDASSDSEQYVVIQPEGGVPAVEGGVDSMFRVPGGAGGPGAEPARAAVVELASEVLEEGDTTSPSEHSLASTYKRRDLVSVATLRLAHVELLQHSAGFASTIKLQVRDVTSDDCGSIPWDEFQSKFSSRSRAWIDAGEGALIGEEAGISRVRLRLDHEPASDPAACDARDRAAVRTLFRDAAEVRTAGLRLHLPMSAAIGLADLIEDELLPDEQLPVHVQLDDLLLTLLEDRPPSNITSPGPVPLCFRLDKLDVVRGTDGQFHVRPRAEPLVALASPVDDAELRRLRSEATTLRARLSVLERAADEARSLRRARDEADTLRMSLASAQDDIARLLDDKRALLEELRRMRDQMQGVQQISHSAQTAPNKR